MVQSTSCHSQAGGEHLEHTVHRRNTFEEAAVSKGAQLLSQISLSSSVGKMTRITLDPDHTEEQSQQDRPRNSIAAKWLGHPRVIPDILESTPNLEEIHSGELKFWSSVATIYLFTEHQRLRGKPRTTFLSSSGNVLMASAHLDSEQYTTRQDLHVPKEVRDADDDLEGGCYVTILDLVIVHGEITQTAGVISGLSSSGRVFRALSVRWRDGIAYREGFVLIAEEYWVSPEDKEWKLVTLR